MRKINIGGTEFTLGCESKGLFKIELYASYAENNETFDRIEVPLPSLRGLTEEEIIKVTQVGLLELEQKVHELVSGEGVELDFDNPSSFVSHVVQFGLPVGKEGFLEQLTDVQQ